MFSLDNLNLKQTPFTASLHNLEPGTLLLKICLEMFNIKDFENFMINFHSLLA